MDTGSTITIIFCTSGTTPRRLRQVAVLSLIFGSFINGNNMWAVRSFSVSRRPRHLHGCGATTIPPSPSSSYASSYIIFTSSSSSSSSSPLPPYYPTSSQQSNPNSAVKSGRRCLSTRLARSSIQDFFHHHHHHHTDNGNNNNNNNNNNDDDNDDESTTSTIITYITDVEGDKAYLDRYVELSKVLTFVTPEESTTTPTSSSSSSISSSISSASPVFPRFYYSNKQRIIDFTHPRAMLVFGGDIWDKGGYDLYTIRQLLDLKRRYPDRVVFILGNRDVNKLRILQEIGIGNTNNNNTNNKDNEEGPPPPTPPPTTTTPDYPGLMWFQGTGKIGDPTDPNLAPPTDAAKRLQWMFANTMGSPDAFEHRRHELQWEKQMQQQDEQQQQLQLQQQGGDDGVSSSTLSAKANYVVTDQEVVDSYRASCHPNGELGQFLSQAQLVCKLGPLLFVHGSIPLISEHVEKVQVLQQNNINDASSPSLSSVWDDLTFCMPWLPEGETAQDHGVTTIDQWMTALNDFCHTKVEEWKADITRIEAIGGVDDSEHPIWAREAGYHYGPPYSDLIQYGMGMLPNRKKNPSVIYNTFTPSGMPNRFYPDSEEPQMVKATKEFFDRAGVQVILAGHKPQGDMPSPIRVDDSQWVLLGDTSYSGETIWHHHDDDPDNDSSDPSGMTERRTNLGRGNSVSFRGEVAVSEILIELKGEALASVAYHGVLSDGSEYETVNLLTHGKNTTIGQVAPDHLVPSALDSPHQGRWWTKSIFSDGSHLFHAGQGFHIWNFVGKKEPR